MITAWKSIPIKQESKRTNLSRTNSVM